MVGDGNAGTYVLYIEEYNYFSLVALNFSDTVSLDKRISAALYSDPRYGSRSRSCPTEPGRPVPRQAPS